MVILEDISNFYPTITTQLLPFILFVLISQYKENRLTSTKFVLTLNWSEWLTNINALLDQKELVDAKKCFNSDILWQL